MTNQSRKRHLAKTITWRITATLTTFLLTWFISDDIKIGIAVGSWEFGIKMALYYFHERIWYSSNFGLDKSKRKSQ
ncbi:MAG: DUF2061 domain-containing protein [Crocinitomicaceae bacterium]|nr:DUF2061 domain-containing protein [Crocinitomicaceae bacterium]